MTSKPEQSESKPITIDLNQLEDGQPHWLSQEATRKRERESAERKKRIAEMKRQEAEERRRRYNNSGDNNAKRS